MGTSIEAMMSYITSVLLQQRLCQDVDNAAAASYAEPRAPGTVNSSNIGHLREGITVRLYGIPPCAVRQCPHTIDAPVLRLPWACLVIVLAEHVLICASDRLGFLLAPKSAFNSLTVA